ncbi:lipocalin family protein [Dyadobacter sp. CY326]|uniref:lipocalin family protein n=1 Tax=Dyadobacter sp. CY326 TaxID=2907300 RepID=UPI001F2E195F|nr:lipocalin family protein [Dyadobacter sp. CY326]MCE7068331.1 lipocalin family protein [Dyadobacter sp. CY326]
MKIYSALSKITLLTFLLMAFVITACNDDDDKPDLQTEDTNPIVGTWQLQSVTPETAGTTIPALAFITQLAPCYLDLKLTFNSNNTITAADCPTAVSAIDPFVPVGTDAKWKVDGDKLTLTRGTTSQEFKITQTATNLTVVVNTETDDAKPPVNALLVFKKV